MRKAIPAEGAQPKDNSLLVKYFSESFRPQLIGKKKDESLVIQLSKAFDEKERAWVLQDLGLDKESAVDAEKYFKLTITKVGLVEKSALDETFFKKIYPSKEIKTDRRIPSGSERRYGCPVRRFRPAVSCTTLYITSCSIIPR